ncbi:MAG: prephenate dehydrogenase/arogenate dehydrogenase family protein [Chloroflexi bacterium]|nr:prephenate dehydrogenase/arogenate dehydrogenase family protein [Chloroflexota bacterium]
MTLRVTIIGLGLIGGSIGLALRQGKADAEIAGHTRNFDRARLAQKRGAIDRAEWNLPAAVERADLVVVATPAAAVREVFAHIAPHLRAGAVVTDVASTKQQVLAWAEELLPPSVSFVGGHPMAGKEQAGIEAADAALFQGCVYCVLPGRGASDEAVNLVLKLVEAVGGRPYFLDPAEHDSYVAAISHLPFLLSATLVNAVATSPAWRDLSRLAAGGFRDVTRLASGDPVMHRDICATNRESIRRWVEQFRRELDRMAGLIAADEAGLEAAFDQAKKRRDEWLAERQRAQLPGGPATTS